MVAGLSWTGGAGAGGPGGLLGMEAPVMSAPRAFVTPWCPRSVLLLAFPSLLHPSCIPWVQGTGTEGTGAWCHLWDVGLVLLVRWEKMLPVGQGPGVTAQPGSHVTYRTQAWCHLWDKGLESLAGQESMSPMGHGPVVTCGTSAWCHPWDKGLESLFRLPDCVTCGTWTWCHRSPRKPCH